MTRDEALLRRLAESEAAADSEESSDREESTSQAREGIVSSFEPSDLRERAADDSGTRLEAQAEADPRDPQLDQPPDLPESFEPAEAGPDGTPIGRDAGFTSPTGESIGGSTLSDQIEGRGAELGGRSIGDSRLDPLGMLSRDAADIGAPSDRDVADAIARHDGTAISRGTEPAGPPRVPDPSDAEDPSKADELVDRWSPKPPGDRDTGGPAPAGGGDDPAGGGGDEPPAGDPEEGEEERPDPTGGYDVITQSTIDAAIRTNDPDVYAQPTQDGESHDVAASVARAAAANDPDQVTNYGPEGEQTVGIGDWTPPPDTLFDPPPDASAMGDASAVLGGSVVGSTGEPDFPPPPDPPPGDDGGGTTGPPPDGGGDS